MQDQPTDHDPSSGLGGPLAETLGLLRKHLGTSPDIVLRELEDGENRHRLALCYIDGLIDSTLLTESYCRCFSMPPY
ncbi:spore germination protein [Paenibacillus sp. H1-7]|uniref:spore germination protein n=1 Tax=Paenibacillus sp. H1-7 TaxID=2282849 RepID=UPI001EF88E95|nr:spore germination protein [Paenibacillus sp. H1-7]